MNIYLKDKNKNKKIKILIFSFLVIILLMFIYAYYEPANKDYLVSNCSFKPTTDTPSDIDLPVVVIDTHGEKLKADTTGVPTDFNGTIINILKPVSKVKATFTLYDNCDLENPSIKEEMLINIRGQSSRLAEKKQYSINFEIVDGSPNDVSILGLPKHSKWVLNGSYSDKSLLRNYLAYSFGRDVMAYSPNTRFVEVFINDTDEELSYQKHYSGVYLIIEKIERGKNRVNIKKADDRYNDISFIIARDKIKTDNIVFSTNWGSLEDDFIIDLLGNIKLRTVISSSYPSSSKLTDTYKSKTIDYLNEFEEALYSSYFKDPNKGYRKYIDVNSFIDLAMINEIFKNVDGGEVSTYFYKDIGGKLTAGPLWDFDLTLGNTSFEEVNEPTGFRIVKTIWFNRLFQDPYFCNMYKKRYQYFRKTIWTNEKILEKIDLADKYIKSARERNDNKWYQGIPEKENEVTKIKNFILKRLDWMDRNIDNIRRYENSLE